MAEEEVSPKLLAQDYEATAPISFSHLNDAQREAVTSKSNYVEVLAGPGSGKTMVICHRIEYLVKALAADPASICCVTFTNRAAREMKERTIKLIGEARASQIMMGTFHHVCAVILRKYGDRIGVSQNYTILDSSDTGKLLTTIIKENPYRKSQAKPDKWSVGKFISACKNKRVTPEEAVSTSADDIAVYNSDVFQRYQRILKERNCVDFDDLLGYAVDLFRKAPDILRRIAARYRYVLVDEWQDTSTLQYEIAKGLCSVHKNLFIVGDPDQSIYSWRFARMENIFRFRKDFEGAAVVKLEMNYRSAGNILSLAHRLISQDKKREEKKLVATLDAGYPVQFVSVSDIISEAHFISRRVKALKESIPEYHYGHTAVLYRTNYQSRSIEEEMVRQGLPYRIIGGLGYYERKEVKDLTSYLRLIGNPDDDFSLERIINVPPRKVGEKTIKMIQAEARKVKCSMWAALGTMKGKKAGLDDFIHLIEELQRQSAAGAPSMALLDCVVDQTNYIAYLKEFEAATFQNREENVNELRVACHMKDIEYSKNKQDAEKANLDGKSEDPMQTLAPSPLQHFLTNLALVAGDPREGRSKYEKVDAVNLLTMHAAKGLEWPVVFVIGCDDTSMPHSKAEDYSEERRLLYVSVTRAKALLHILHPSERIFYHDGKRDLMQTPLSRFLTPFVSPGIDCINICKFGSSLPFERQDDPGNAIIKSMCLSFKLKEAPPVQALERRSSSVGSLDDVLPLQRNATSLLSIDDDSISLSEEEVQPPSKSDSLRMLPLEFQFSPGGSKKKKTTRRKSESDASGKGSKKRKRNSAEEDIEIQEAPPVVKKEKSGVMHSSVSPPPPKKSKVLQIDLTGDDSMDFVPLKDKKHRPSAEEMNRKAEENSKRLAEMRKQAKLAQAKALPKPAASVTFVDAPRKLNALAHREVRDSTAPPSSSSSYSMQRASGVALPSIKSKK